MCICASRVCESGSSYSGASDARWANRSFITLQEHSTVQHKPIFLRVHTHTYKDTRRDVYAEDSNTRKYSCVTGQQEEKHSIHVTDSSRHERVQRLAWSAPSLLSEKKKKSILLMITRVEEPDRSSVLSSHSHARIQNTGAETV